MSLDGSPRKGFETAGDVAGSNGSSPVQSPKRGQDFGIDVGGRMQRLEPDQLSSDLTTVIGAQQEVDQGGSVHHRRVIHERGQGLRVLSQRPPAQLRG